MVFNKSTLLAFVISAATWGAAPGCGGSDPLPMAHSSSFYPVRGTGDNGAAAGTLHWSYRINGGKPITSSSTSGLSITFGDEDVLAKDDSTISYATNATLTGPGGASGNETIRQTDHLTPGSSPATIDKREVSLMVSASSGGTQTSTSELANYTFTPPQPTFFDRDDLDSLAAGFTESASFMAMVVVTTTESGPGASPQTQSMTIPATQTWTLMDKLATFQVLGQTYNNVVTVNAHGSAIDPTSGATMQADSRMWLAKGIGMIRAEEDGTFLSTNLVP